MKFYDKSWNFPWADRKPANHTNHLTMNLKAIVVFNEVLTQSFFVLKVKPTNTMVWPNEKTCESVPERQVQPEIDKYIPCFFVGGTFCYARQNHRICPVRTLDVHPIIWGYNSFYLRTYQCTEHANVVLQSNRLSDNRSTENRVLLLRMKKPANQNREAQQILFQLSQST